MPKRYFDVGAMDSTTLGIDKPQRKTERSHEENQERAYIAASRRADRSIEARVQSARMASEIHKRRTGKAFRVTEEIVMKEEMYEEEEDDFPRSYRLLGPHMQTSSPEMNSRVETYLTNRVAMSKLLSASEQDWNNNAINKAFAQTFPNANRQARNMSQRWSTPGYPIPPPPQSLGNRLPDPMDSSFDPSFEEVNYSHHQNDRSRSMSSAVSPSDLDEQNVPSPVLTAGSGSHPHTPQSSSTLFSANKAPVSSVTNVGPDNSVFTSELPAEAKMLMGVDMTDAFGANVYNDQQWSPANSHMYTYPEPPKPTKTYDGGNDNGMYMMDLGSMDWDMTTQAPTDDEPSWDSFINDNAWVTDQQ